ncbi:THUMP domain-containing class I SAM-dependent RNA methyltransferase [Robertkochia solimangrovi]|uniref:THUMP domain-containing class I SAM-dependent RNA methyltransferase n=1 Tax=Robertkochia solimangrovi TaxID=2213046 RepID=UPI00117E2B2E|nr:THUMP domain-containing protein [Robertkochia solimangrovi]TRZ43775.1 class I SAM-dependent RNA methyltransferase [Robertkochia solimangrovi]
MANNYKMLAKTMHGMEEILEKELKQMGAINVEKGIRSVSFEGDLGFMYKANLSLRTAIKILKPMKSFFIRSEQDLYNRINRIEWEQYLKVDGTFAIDATVNSKLFNHSHYIALKTKDAIVDRFRDSYGKRPDVDLKHPDLRINIHIHGNQCNVSFDSSGSSLHHRGYRTATNMAPINEVLAAGILLLSGWDGQCDFMDPMCGSGTMAIEAAMIACNIPANINRREFAFEKWQDYDEELFEKIFDSCMKKTREFHFKIRAFDKAPSAVRKALDNVKNANLSNYITVDQQDFFESTKEGEEKLHMVFNPPYGQRLEIDIENFYKHIGDTLKQGYPNTEAWFISSNLEAIKSVGLRPSRKIHLYNGKLDSRLLKFEIYAGSKKAKYNN